MLQLIYDLLLYIHYTSYNTHVLFVHCTIENYNFIIKKNLKDYKF